MGDRQGNSVEILTEAAVQDTSWRSMIFLFARMRMLGLKMAYHEKALKQCEVRFGRNRYTMQDVHNKSP